MQLRQAKTDISAQFEISPAVMTSQQIWIPIKWERLESRCLLVHRLSDDGPGLCMGESVSIRTCSAVRYSTYSTVPHFPSPTEQYNTKSMYLTHTYIGTVPT